jgi:hypothetical protein
MVNSNGIKMPHNGDSMLKQLGVYQEATREAILVQGALYQRQELLSWLLQLSGT